MIIDGRDVQINYRSAQSIQQKIDCAKEIPETAKVEIPKKELKEIVQNIDSYNSYYDTNNFGDMFGSSNNTGAGILTGKNSSENRANYYDMFSEMAATPWLHRGLEVISDDACQKNTDGDTVKIYSDDEEIKDTLEELFHERLNLNKELWSIIFETITYGDNFYEIIPDDYEHPTCIARIRYLDPKKVNRIEKNGKLAFYTYRTEAYDESDYSTGIEETQNKQQEVFYRLQPWQIVHFRINNKKFQPYGGSLLDPGIETYKRYSMLEDSILIYRLARVPERRIFSIDVGNLSTTEAMRAINKIKDNYRSSQIMDDKGRINKQAAALSLTEDIFIPVREGQQGTRIDTLQPGQGLNNIDDIRHFRDELLWTLYIPPEYLGYTSDQGGGNMQKGSLAMQDVKFARFVERIQYHIEEGLTKIAAIELFFKKKKKGDLKNFKIELTPPSNVKEIMDIEYLNQKIGLVSAMLSTQLFPKDFVLKYVMKLSKKEIADINLQKEIEMGMGQQAGGGMDMMGGGMPPMDMGGAPGGAEMPPMDMGGAPGGAPIASSVKTEELTPEKMVSVFGKDLLIEHKEDYSKLMKALEEYNIEKENRSKKEKEEIEMYESMSNSEFINSIKGILFESAHESKNKSSSSLYYENEFGGLNFANKEFTVYNKDYKEPKKARGKKGSKVLTEEVITRKL